MKNEIQIQLGILVFVLLCIGMIILKQMREKTVEYPNNIYNIYNIYRFIIYNIPLLSLLLLFSLSMVLLSRNLESFIDINKKDEKMKR